MSAWKRLVQHRNVRAAFAYTSQQFNVLSKLFARQCEAVAAQRVRRAWQLCILYSRIYDRRFLKRLIDHFKQRLLLSRLSLGRQTLFSATMFSMLKGEISDEEMNSEIQTLIEDFNIVRSNSSISVKTSSWLSTELVNETESNVRESAGSKKWELIVSEPSFRVWRWMNTQIGAYEYRVFGSFNDVSARSFYATQIDLAYRKTWDESVLLIDVLDTSKEKQDHKVEPLEPSASESDGNAVQLAQVQSNPEGGSRNQSELIRWVTQYPFPLPTREYVYRRRQFYDKEKNFFFVLSRSVSDTDDNGEPGARSRNSAIG